jgi:uncharacterized protein involved in exopolysaccharide biosynthesis/Mrp family chromosome partitioning ATPase
MLHAPQKVAYRREIEPDAAPSQWSLNSLCNVIRWRRSSIILAIISCLGIAIAYLAITPLSYKATAVVETDTKRTPPQPNEFTPDSTIDMAVVETQLEAIRSENLALSVIDKLSLWNDPEFGGERSGLRSWIAGLLHGFRSTRYAPAAVSERERKRQAALDHFRRGLKVERIGRSYVTQITFESRNPETAARVANAIADGYIDDQLNAKQETLQRSNEWMQARIAKLRSDADAAAKAADVFKASNPLNVESTLAKLHDLQAQAESSRAAYQTAVNRFNQALQLQQQSVPATEARILTEATPPRDGSSPKAALVLMLAFVGGGTLGAAGAFGREFLQNLVRSPRQLKAELGVKTLCAVPNVPQRRLLGLRRSHTPLVLIDSTAKAKTSFSVADEAIRSLKIAVDQYRRDKSCVIGVTSAGGAEGRTTLAFNLALLGAQCGRRVLLIDGNLRNRKLSSFLAPEQTHGLQTLADQSSEFGLCVTNWQETFAFLGGSSDAIKRHPGEILGSPIIAAYMKTASEDYDYVILDLPPALNCSEVQAIAPLTDGFIFVAEWGKTSLQDIERAVANSDVVVQRLIGVALNKVPDGEQLTS